MNKLFRYYNQNRKSIWKIVIIAIFVIVIIQLLNRFAREKSQAEIERNAREALENANNVANSQKDYTEESKAIISDSDVSEKNRDTFGKLIDQFYTACIEHRPEDAYKLLSSDVKKVEYQTQEIFEQLYYKNKFEGDKQYSFQAWTTSSNKATYLVKIYDNMLASGKKNDEYIEDYITVVKDNNNYKLNVNKYICRTDINKKYEDDEISILVEYADSYKDYEIYTFTIKNKTNNRILIDTREKSKTLFLTAKNDAESRYDSFLYENKENDFMFEAEQAKTIKIKFNRPNSSSLIRLITFSDIVNYDEYLQNKQLTKKKVEIEI